MDWILFYYNSLPDMPIGCRLFSSDIVHRDYFKCNPSNTGHYEYPKFETFSYDENCHEREVIKILKRNDPEKYVIFYTRNYFLLGGSRNIIVGFFKVGQQNIVKTKRGFTSSLSVLLPKNKCIEIKYTARGVPVSWGNSSVKNDINSHFEYLLDNQYLSIGNKYRDETRGIMSLLGNSFGRRKIIQICEDCSVNEKCFWGRQTNVFKDNRLRDLYGGGNKCS